MTRKPKDWNDLRVGVPLSYRTALTVAAILPNLPDDESLIVLRQGKRWHTDIDTLDKFRRRHDPIPGTTDVYRVTTDDSSSGRTTWVDPEPHGTRSYRLKNPDVIELVPADDPTEYDFAEPGSRRQSRITDFAGGSTTHLHDRLSTADGGSPGYDRRPSLPV